MEGESSGAQDKGDTSEAVPVIENLGLGDEVLLHLGPWQMQRGHRR